MISIHAPVKGATYASEGDDHVRKISIHAPVKGATQTTYNTTATNQISIHAPVKGATAAPIDLTGAPGISINAPVKGATVSLQSRLATAEDFNPRSREGSDDSVHTTSIWETRFQSTLP